jgi:hypothetical protein
MCLAVIGDADNHDIDSTFGACDVAPTVCILLSVICCSCSGVCGMLVWPPAFLGWDEECSLNTTVFMAATGYDGAFWPHALVCVL